MKKVNEVFETKNYSMFSSLTGNRDVNPAQVKRLVSSMKKKQLQTPIVVNEKYEVIDGQHRLEACKQLELPVYFLIMEGYGLSEVQSLNLLAKNWTAIDYCDAYIELGFTDYKIFKNFFEMYDLGINETIAILMNSHTIGGDYFAKFKEGNFKVGNLSIATTTIERIVSTKTYVVFYQRRSYITALMRLFQNSDFDFERFVRKLKNHSSMLSPCNTRNEMIAQIEKMYNYKESKKIRLTDV